MSGQSNAWNTTVESVVAMLSILGWGYLVHINGFHPTTSALGILTIAGLGGYRVLQQYFETRAASKSTASK